MQQNLLFLRLLPPEETLKVV